MRQQAAGSRQQIEVRSYRDLVVWQKAIDLTVVAYRLTAELPRDELYGLASQIRRSAASIPANIAEGYGRQSRASYTNFLRISRGSLRELESHVIVAERVGLVRASSSEQLLRQCDELGRILHGLLRRLEVSE